MNGANEQPFVSFIIPTYNAERYLALCLESIYRQAYAKDKMEVIIIDGGSDDRTLDIAKRFSAKIINNPDRIAEFAKSIGIKNARGKYLIIFDSDNEIAQEEWLKKMIFPLENDTSIFGMDASYLVKDRDYLVNRYCALLRLEDPLVRYMANLADNAVVEQKNNYSVYQIKKGRFPIFGSNGFIWRKAVLEDVGGYIPRFDEADFCVKVIERGFNRIGFIKEAGIYHHHLENIAQFIGKRLRRGNEFMSRQLTAKGIKKTEAVVWLDKYSKWELLKSVFLCLSIIYPLCESIRGYLKDRDIAWFLHPLLSFLTVVVYGMVFLRYIIFR